MLQEKRGMKKQMEDKKKKKIYTLGGLIQQTRNKYGITRKELAKGLFVEQVLLQLEDNQCIADKFTWDFLLSRLGISTNIYECYVTQEEWEWYEAQITIRDMVNQCLEMLYEDNGKKSREEELLLCIRKGKKLCSDYRRKIQKSEKAEGFTPNIHLLFVTVMEGYFLMAEGIDGNTRLLELETMRECMKIEPIHLLIQSDKCYFSLFELELLLLIADAYQGIGEIIQARELLQWVSTYSKNKFNSDKEELVKLYPYVMWRLAKLEEQCGNEQKVALICFNAMELLIETASLRGMIPIMDMLLKYWKDKLTLTLCPREQLEEQRQCLLELFSQYGGNPYAIYPLMMIENATLVNELIKKQRQWKQIRQCELCEGIVEPETLSRLENGKRIVRWKKIQLLLERLSLPMEKERLYLESHEVAIVQKYQKIATSLYKRQMELARREIEEVEKELDTNSLRNKQYLLFTKALIQREDYFMRECDFKVICENALKVTIEAYPNVALEQRVLSRQEGIILNNIGLNYKTEKKLEEAMSLFEHCYSIYNYWKISKKYLNNSQSAIVNNFTSLLGNQNQYERAIQLSEQLIYQTISKGSLRGVSGMLYEILWNLYEYESNKKTRETCKKLFVQALSLAILERDKEEVKFLLNGKEKYMNIKH